MLTLPAELEDEFAELQFALDNTENGGWFFCVYKQAIVRDELMARIKTECELPIFQWQYSNETPSYPIDYLNSLSDPQKQNRAIVFFINVTTGGDKVIKSLDFNREKFSEYPHCLVFFLTELELKDVAITAGHFWAQRRGRFDFSELFILEQENKNFDTGNEWENPLLHVENYKEAENILNFYLRELAKIKNKNKKTISLAELYTKIGYLLNYLGKYDEAIPYVKQALIIFEQKLGKNHSDVAAILNNLANLYKTQGLYKEALPLHQRALVICEQQLGKNHLNIAVCLNNLADLYYIQEHYDEAVLLHERALAIREQQLGENPITANTLSNLGILYSSQGRYSEAETIYKRALAIREQQLGEHPDTANTLNNLASLYHNQGRYSEAEPLCQRALRILQNTLGKEHPTTQVVQKHHTALLKKLNNPDDLHHANHHKNFIPTLFNSFSARLRILGRYFFQQR